MDHNTTVLKHEPAAFALPAGLDRSPLHHFAFDGVESRPLNASLVTLESLGLSVDAADVALLAEPIISSLPGTPSYSSTDSNSGNSCTNRATPHRKIRARRDGLGMNSATSPMLHRHHFKKTSRKEVHELQARVHDMQTQVDCAAAEVNQLAQLVNQFAHQREQEKQKQEVVRRREEHEQQLLEECEMNISLEEQQLLEECEMNMGLEEQQRHLRAQVEHDREQFEREQQRCFECKSPEQEAFRF